MKALRRLALFALLSALFAAPARAQFLGYTFPQTVTQTVANGVACTGSAQAFSVANLGQTVHFATLAATGAPGTFNAYIQGLDSAGNSTVISDVGTLSTTQLKTALTGVGYYPQVQIVVTCLPVTSTFVITYAGTSASSPTDQGQALSNRVTKMLANSAPAGTAFSLNFVPPYANESGYLTAIYSGTGPSGSTITITCLAGGTTDFGHQTFNLATTALALQVFPVSALPCPQMIAGYIPGGMSANGLQLAYHFNPPGAPQQFAYAYVNATNLTAKTGPGFVHTLTIDNIAAAGSYAVYDNTSCSGTLITASTLTAAIAADTITLDANFNTGLCVTTTGTVTVSFN